MHRTRQSIEAGILSPIKYHTFFTGFMDRNRSMLSLVPHKLLPWNRKTWHLNG